MRYFVYLIPYRDAAGDKFYCGYSKTPGTRESQHDRTRFSHKCPTCLNGFIIYDASWKTGKCPECNGTHRVLNTTTGRIKTGRMHVSQDGTGFEPYQLRSRKAAMKYERKIKAETHEFKQAIYDISRVPEKVRAY